MVNLELELDEGIVLQTTYVERYGIKEVSLNEMVLTNKNIVCVYEKSTGLFSKPEIIIEKLPLSSIKVANGQAQVMVHDSDEYGEGLQVLFISGQRELFIFFDSSKKTLTLWINEINKILLGEPIIPVQAENIEPTYSPESKHKKSFLGGLVGALGGLDVQSVVDKAQEKIENLANQIQDVTNQFLIQDVSVYSNEYQEEETSVVNVPVHKDETTTPPPIPKAENNSEIKVILCSNCGIKLNEGSKFCHGCGVAVGTIAPKQKPQAQAQPQSELSHTERQQEYVGKVLKCPYCGGILETTDVRCSHCGSELSGKEAVSSAKDFQQQMMALEKTRKKKKILGATTVLVLDETDQQILSLIRTYPIPNTIEDIVEFMLLAVANINVKISKRTVWNSDHWSGASSAKEISNAWVTKMEQIYRKAEVVFPNEAAFVEIKKIYSEKMTELKIKVD